MSPAWGYTIDDFVGELHPYAGLTREKEK